MMAFVINENLTKRLGHECKEKFNESPRPSDFIETEYCYNGDMSAYGMECLLCGYEVTPDELNDVYGDINLDQYGD